MVKEWENGYPIVVGVKHKSKENKLKLKERSIMKMAARAQTNHMERLQEKKCTFEQGLTFVEALNSFTRIVNHVMNIAEASATEPMLISSREAAK